MPEALPEPRTARHDLRPGQAKTRLQRSTRPLRDGSAEELADIKEAIRRLETRQAEQDEIKAAIQRLETRLAELHERVRGIQQEQQHIQAQIETLEVFQVQADVRLAWLEHWRRIATGAGDAAVLEAEELASFMQLKHLARLLSAAIERLLEIQGRVDQLEPKPPPRSKGGRPRRDRRR
jgi:DNA repair exonuclease SbcCD ATPase subunit